MYSSGSQFSLQVLHHGVHTSQSSNIYPVFNSIPEDSRIWRSGSGLGVPWISRKSPRGQTEVHPALQGGCKLCLIEFLFYIYFFFKFRILFLKELVAAYAAEAKATGKPQLMLTAAVSAGKGTIDAGYEIAQIAKWVCLEFSQKVFQSFWKKLSLVLFPTGNWTSSMWWPTTSMELGKESLDTTALCTVDHRTAVTWSTLTL